ncbi:hypothetical protein [Spiroplasma endosymbiont of Labia minor]|uniref:hypothetical protein n=1 Tax=Spiroplasma endosymbiont of Labia minor TaxID=3066305 RepID=UPI0030D3CA48
MNAQEVIEKLIDCNEALSNMEMDKMDILMSMPDAKEDQEQQLQKDLEQIEISIEECQEQKVIIMKEAARALSAEEKQKLAKEIGNLEFVSDEEYKEFTQILGL